MDSSSLVLPIKLHMFAMAIVLTGSLGFGLWDALKPSSSFLHRLLHALIAAAAAYLIWRRDVYLPFLGQAAYPCGSLTEKVPEGADITVFVNAPPGSNVIYWAAEEANRVIDNPWTAYSKYSNAGVATADENGRAALKVRRPAAYKIPSGRQLAPHIHYRVCIEGGMLAPVKTAAVL